MAMSTEKQTRREFLGKVAFGIAGAGAGLSLVEKPLAAAGEMPYRAMGRSAEKVSLVGLGGYHIGVPRDEQEGIRIIHAAIDNGINFMDNCWDYHGGESEVRMGKALKGGYRQKAFLMTKIDGQVKPAAEKQLEESLRRLQVDTIDLMQFHEVVRMKDPDRIFGPNGAIETLVKARKEGKIRYIGFTGHQDPDIHVKMLKMAFKNDFTFDAVQFPLNPMDPHYRSFEKNVVPILVEHGIGVLGMKPLGGGNLLRSGTVTATECLQYAMNLPTSVVITGCESMERLNQALTAARTFQPMTEKQVAALLAKTADAAKDGKFEPFKSTRGYNATDRHPEWLG
jgi:predicted aldo/keto reductase-like oxidoreductase